MKVTLIAVVSAFFAAVFATSFTNAVHLHMEAQERQAQFEAGELRRAEMKVEDEKREADRKAEKAALHAEVERECRAMNGSIFAMPPKHGPMACILPPGAIIPAHWRAE